MHHNPEQTFLLKYKEEEEVIVKGDADKVIILKYKEKDDEPDDGSGPSSEDENGFQNIPKRPSAVDQRPK